MRTKLLVGISVIWAVFQLLSIYVINLEALQMVSMHLAFGISVAFLVKPLQLKMLNRRFTNGMDIILSVLSLLAGLYFIMEYERIRNHMPFISEFPLVDSLIGGFVVLMTIEATRRVLGLPLTIMGVLSLIYLVIGPHISGIFRTREISIPQIVEYNYFTTNGLFGIALQTSATYVYIFVLFACLLEISGLGPKFMDIVISFAGKWRGGPAKVAVLGSGLFGMITGSPSSNVAFTGSFTIPMMKKTGFRPEFAGAVESVASSGGMIVPPLMGTAIFLIVQFTQSSITTVILAAILPALLYFFALFMQVDLEAAKNQIKAFPPDQIPDFRTAMQNGWFLLVPILVIVIMLLAGYSPQLSAMLAILLAIPLSFMSRDSRLTFSKILSACVETAKTMLIVVTATATAGVVLASISFAGLEFKLTTFLLSLAGDNMLLLVLFTAILSYILGMGLPVLPAYIIVSLITAPLLVDAGLSAVTAHLFVFYFAMMSLYTPPVAPCSFVAAGIAEAGPFRVGWESMKLGIGALAVPFLFVYHPALLSWTPWTELLLSLIPVAAGIYALCCSLTRFIHSRLSGVETALVWCCTLLMFVPFTMLQLIGLIVFALIWLNNRRRKAILQTDLGTPA